MIDDLANLDFGSGVYRKKLEYLAAAISAVAKLANIPDDELQKQIIAELTKLHERNREQSDDHHQIG